MIDEKDAIHKMLSMIIATALILGLVAPTIGSAVGSASLSTERAVPKGVGMMGYDYIEGDLIIEEGETRIEEDRDLLVDGDVIIEEEGTLIMINSTITLRQDTENQYNITVHSGTLDLDNSTITTWIDSEEEGWSHPFLKTDVTIKDGSFLSLNNDSSFSFPGFVHIQDSEFDMIGSRFEALDEDEIPNYDYLWDGDLETQAQEDNNDGPRLFVQNSEVYMERSEINDYYTNDNFPEGDTEYNTDEMTWYPLDDDGEPIEELQDNDNDIGIDELEIGEWFLSNPMVPHEYLEEYPYINPVDLISSLYIEVEYDTSEDYDGEAYLNYSSPEEGWIEEAIQLDETETLGEKFLNIWEMDLSRFYEEERGDQWRWLFDLDLSLHHEGHDIDGDNYVNVTELRLVSSYDNDIHVENSIFTAIDSFIDVDIEKSDVDPRGNDVDTCKETYLHNANMDHRTIRLYGGSEFRSYGLEIADDNVSDHNYDVDPWILNTEEEHNKTWIYRQVELQVTTEGGIGLPGVRLDPKPAIEDDLEEEINFANDLTEPHNQAAWDFLNETGYGYYDPDEEMYVSGDDGNTTMFLASDRLNYPEDWPNSKFVGNYDLYVNYTDDDISVEEEVKIDHLEDFPTMENPQITNVVIPVPLPDLEVEDLSFRYEGEETHRLPEDESGELGLTVKNIGESEAKNIDLAFYYRQREDEEKIKFVEEKDWSDLGPGENETLYVEWPGEEEVGRGDYTLTAEIDPEQEILEECRENNIDEINITVTEGPDLSVDQIHIDAEEYEIRMNENRQLLVDEKVNVYAGIINEGEFGIDDLSVWINITDKDGVMVEHEEFKVDIEGAPGGDMAALQESISGPPYSYNETDPLEWEPGDLGDYTVSVELEGTESRLEEEITVLSKPELSLTLYDIEDNYIGENVQISADIENLGEWPSEATTVEFILDDEESIHTADIEPGIETQPIDFTWTAEMSEDVEDLTEVREITASIDQETLDLDSKEGNLYQTTDLTVKRRAGLEVDAINFHEDNFFREGEVMDGKDITFSAEVQNSGADDIYGAEVEIGIEGEESSIYNNDSIYLEPDQVKPFEDIQWSTDEVESGDYELYVDISVENGEQNVEGTEDRMTKSFSILERPQLTIEAIEFSEDPIRVGEEVEIKTTIENIGGWVSEEVNADFLVEDEDGEYIEIGSENLEEGIESGDEETLSMIWEAEMLTHYLGAIEEARDIRVEVDLDPYQEEEDEDILSITDEINIERHVDLAITGEIDYPEERTKGDPVVITSTIVNEGDLRVTNFEIEYYKQEVGVAEPEKTRIGNLTFDETLDVRDGYEEHNTEITFQWDTSDAVPDDYIIIAEIKEDVQVEIDGETVNERDKYLQNNVREGQVELHLKSPPNLVLVEESWEVKENGEWESFYPNDMDTSLIEKGEIRFSGTVQNTNETALDLGAAYINIEYPDETSNELLGDEYDEVVLEQEDTVEIEDEWTVEFGQGDQLVTLNMYIGPAAEEEYLYNSTSWSLDIDEIQEIVITNENFPESPYTGGTYTFEGTLERGDGRPLVNTGVTITLKIGDSEVSEMTDTDSNGDFSVDIEIPEEEGEYDIIIQAHTEASPDYTFSEAFNAQTETLEILGMPWWVLLVIVIIAAGGSGSTVAYFKFFREREMVECGNCGSTISADANNCPKCGVEFDLNTVKCSECEEWIPADADTCPECDAQFVKTGEEVEDYTERMRKQFRKFVDKQKRRAEEELDTELTREEFMEWWKEQPSFVTFDEWLERKEKQRREGSKECPECGTLNNVDAAVCQKCGESLIEFGEIEMEQEDEEVDEEMSEAAEEDLQEIAEIEEELDIDEEISSLEDEDLEVTESEKSKDVSEKQEEQDKKETIDESPETTKKKPKKRKKVKKRVVKKPSEDEED